MSDEFAFMVRRCPGYCLAVPARAARPFRPIRRSLRIAITVSVVFAVVFYGSGHPVVQSVVMFVGVFALALGMCTFLYRDDIAAVARARRKD